MKSMLYGLLDSKGRIAEEVHAIRKLGKSLRGGFTLFRLEKSAALEIQAVGRLLAAPRDAVSRQNTWNKLVLDLDPPLYSAISALLELHVHSAARKPPESTVDWASTRVDEALSKLNQLSEEELLGRIASGLEKLATQVSKRCRRLKEGAEEDFHEARKSLKAWLGALDFLPKEMVGQNPLLQEMAEFLGDENDLATLSAWLETHGFTRHFAPGLWETLESSRTRLQTRAVKDAKKLKKAGEIHSFKRPAEVAEVSSGSAEASASE